MAEIWTPEIWTHGIWVNAVATLLVTVDPVGLAPIFVALTQGLSPSARREVGFRAVLISTVILWLTALVGEPFMAMLGITLPAFHIAGGILLFVIAFEMVFERRTERKQSSARNAIDTDHIRNLAAFPLAIPLMAGPGSITATILIAGQVEGSLIQTAILMCVIAGVMMSCLVVFLMSGPIDRLLGTTGRIVLTRILGVILAALAIQFVADGITSFIPAS